MEKHTPGPWKQETLGAQLHAVKICGNNARRIVPAGGPALAYLPEGREDIQEANALLMAAAPELLEACEACWPLIAAQSLAGDLLRAAIAKATGKV